MSRIRQARKCPAHRRDGKPCQEWAMNGARVCWMHGGAAPQVRRIARERQIEVLAYRAVVSLSSSPAWREHQQLVDAAFPGQDSAFREAVARWAEEFD
jgi:hypothetical protein